MTPQSDKEIQCPNCNDKYRITDFFYSDHKHSINNWGMCFHCCRFVLGHAGYGE